MKLKKNEMISSLGPLRPYEIIDEKTGEIITELELVKQLGSLMEYLFS